MEKLVLVDGNALLHRAFHAIPPLTTSKGELVNAVYGFAMMLLRALSDLKPDYVIVTFDKSGPTFRHQEYTQYKATRTAAPDGLYEQFPRVKELVAALSIPIYELQGYEADDLIATLARQAKDHIEVIIATGDKDSYQVVDKNVKVFSPRKSFSDPVILDEKAVEDKMGVRPDQIPDFKGLAGDPSDNIPGVDGIGSVGAAKLLQKYETVENLYQHLAELPLRMQKVLAEGAEQAILSKNLAVLDDHAPIELDLDQARLSNYSKDKVLELFQELEFRSLINKLPEVSKAYLEQEKGQVGLFTPSTSETSSERPKDDLLSKVLRETEANGVLIDANILSKLKVDVDKKIKKVEKDIYQNVGHDFNLNSPKQLSEVLFDELHLSTTKKGKSVRSTAVEVLNSLKEAHPAIPLILQYREMFKLKSTYIDALPALIDPKDGRLHTTYRDDVARTGRLSSHNPNLQNIPTRGEMGQQIRRAFIAPKGSVLLKGDYNQIELRVMAHYSQDPTLLEIFKTGQDIHSSTAAWIFKKDPKQVTSDERRVAKTVNFGVLYGMSAYGLSQSLGIDPKLASEFITSYYDRFPKVRQWQEQTKQAAYRDGYVETLAGFRRVLLELKSSSYLQRQAGERMAINMPIQGTAADIIKKAMIDISQIFKKEKLKAKMILQVHDELVFEVPESEVSKVSELVKRIMEESFSLVVPIMVEIKVGPNWADMRAYAN